jgi:hypothetical protein
VTSTRETFPLKHDRGFTLHTVKQITDKTAVATVRIGPVEVGCVWVNDLQGTPEVAWPRTTRGFAIASITDERLRGEIETAIKNVVASWGDYRSSGART